MNCVVFKLDNKLHSKLMNFYKAYEMPKKPPYSKFQAKNYDVTITLYESGKVMFQGIGADIESSIWITMQEKLTGKKCLTNDQKKETRLFRNAHFAGDRRGEPVFCGFSCCYGYSLAME